MVKFYSRLNQMWFLKYLFFLEFVELCKSVDWYLSSVKKILSHDLFKYCFFPVLFSPSGIAVIHLLDCLTMSHGSFLFCSF